VKHGYALDQADAACEQTTMNVYGKAMTDSKRHANSKVVQMVLQEPHPQQQATGT